MWRSASRLSPVTSGDRTALARRHPRPAQIVGLPGDVGGLGVVGQAQAEVADVEVQPVEQQVGPQMPQRLGIGLDQDHRPRPTELGNEDRMIADIGAQVEEHAAGLQVRLDDAQFLGLVEAAVEMAVLDGVAQIADEEADHLPAAEEFADDPGCVFGGQEGTPDTLQAADGGLDATLETASMSRNRRP